MPFFGYYNKAVVLTYMSVVSAVFGLAFVSSDVIEETPDRVLYALLALIISGICDAFDGTVARRCERDDRAQCFGIQIDSLADTVAFLALPAMILIHVGQSHPLAVVAASMYIVLGVVRLAWFNVSVEEAGGVFQGVPVTQISFTLPFIYLLVNTFAPAVLFPVLFVVFILESLLFVANVRIPKPSRGWLYLFVVLYVATAVTLVLAARP